VRISHAPSSSSSTTSSDDYDPASKGFEQEFLVEELSEGSIVFRNPLRPYEHLKISQVQPCQTFGLKF